MKILVIGGMHGNEPLGINLVKYIQSSPIKNVSVVIANKKAVKKNARFVGGDLNRSFPGKSRSKKYENQRAFEILNLCKKFDLVLDFHNTWCPNNNCSFIGEAANSSLLNLSSYLGLNRLIIADYNCINKYSPNCISVEISMNDKLFNVNYWYKKIVNLSKLDCIPKIPNVQKYKFIYRMTLNDKEKFSLDKKSLAAFKSLSKTLCKKMNLKYPAYPIFIADKFTPYNYGGILYKV